MSERGALPQKMSESACPPASMVTRIVGKPEWHGDARCANLTLTKSHLRALHRSSLAQVL